MTMTPEDRIDELCHKVVLAPDERKLKAALDELQSALQEDRDYLESVAGRLSFKSSSRHSERLSKLHEMGCDLGSAFTATKIGGESRLY